jgi:hypothetical protein
MDRDAFTNSPAIGRDSCRDRREQMLSIASRDAAAYAGGHFEYFAKALEGGENVMAPKVTRLAIVSAAMGMAIGAAIVCMPAVPAMAQAAGMAGIGQSDTISVRATVKSVDLKSRTVTLVGPQGNAMTLKVGDEVRNLPQVRPGNKVIVRYHASVAYVLAPKGTRLPDDSLTAGAARAAPGQLPAGAIGSKLVVTGTVVGVDPVAHTLQLVNPSGGMIRTVDVVTPEGQKAMNMIQVGDTITAVITEAVAVAVEPAT